MRIVNQKKTIDIQYERVNLFLYGERILVSDSLMLESNSAMELGKYGTESRAKEVMKEIRKTYEYSLYTDTEQYSNNTHLNVCNSVYEMPEI